MQDSQTAQTSPARQRLGPLHLTCPRPGNQRGARPAAFQDTWPCQSECQRTGAAQPPPPAHLFTIPPSSGCSEPLPQNTNGTALIHSALPQTGDRSCSSPGKPGSGIADETPWRDRWGRGECGKSARPCASARGQPSFFPDWSWDRSSGASAPPARRAKPGPRAWAAAPGAVSAWGAESRKPGRGAANSVNSEARGQLIHRVPLLAPTSAALRSARRRGKF